MSNSIVSTRPHTPTWQTRPPRIGLFDILRGVAIIGVVFYHFMFDLRLTGFISLDVTYDGDWVAFAHLLSGAFLALAGTNLVLAHGLGIKWRAFWWRIGVLALASAFITALTLIAFPEAFIYFGILHAIALFSILALPFLRLPFFVPALLAVFVAIAPDYFQSPFFDSRWTSWIGFWMVPPVTGDLVPIFPSFGWTLAGVALGRFMQQTRLGATLGNLPDGGRAGRLLARLGRWSLWIYLGHQLVLLPVLLGLAALTNQPEKIRAADFVQSCQQSCELGQGEAPYCTRYCACALEQVEGADLWDAVSSPAPTPQQSTQISAVTGLCKAMAGR